MSIIAFWNDDKEQTGKTLTAVAVATKMAVERNMKILLITTSYRDATLKNCFWSAPLIMKVPQAFLSALTEYLGKMYDMGKIPEMDFNALAMTVLSSTFGYTFLTASFGNKLSKVEKEEYIKNSVKMFVNGLEQ